MANHPIDLLEPFLSLYGFDAREVSEMRLTQTELFVLECDKDTAIVREVTVRDWATVLPGAAHAEPEPEF